MKCFVSLILISAVCMLTAYAESSLSQELRFARGKPYVITQSESGYVPPPMPLDHLKPSPRLRSLQLPAAFSWLDLGMVTPPKNQGAFGTCWSFTACGDLESKVLINEGTAYDFSEVNLVSCNLNFAGGYTGGTALIAINYLSVWASVLESCDPYPGTLPNPTCINPACTFYRQVTEWQMLAPDITAIKDALYTYGPVQAVAYVDNAWNTYDGTYCIAQGVRPPNHNVLIVGWDDDMCGGGNGGWIIKNSYSTAWGAAGFGYVQYGHNGIEQMPSLYTVYKDYDANEEILYYDEYGWMDQTGYGDGVDWAMIEIIPTSNNWLTGVSFWATSAPTSYTIEVYDNFSGSTASSRLYGPISGTVENAGFYTVYFPAFVPMSNGNAIYIVMRLDTGGYHLPIPYDDSGPMETNKSYVSNTGSSYTALDSGGYGHGDVGIRARVGSTLDRGDPGFYLKFGSGSVEAFPGDVLEFTLGPANFGFVSSHCTANDLFCVHIGGDNSYEISSIPPTESMLSIDSGYYNPMSVTIGVPCDAAGLDTINAYISYWDSTCQDERGDCENPNSYSGQPYYSTDFLVINVVERIEVMHVETDGPEVDINEGQWPVSVPFYVFNDDPCNSPADFSYYITSRGQVGDPIFQEGTVSDVEFGQGKTVYGVLDAREAVICDRDTLTMVCWNEGHSYADTCVVTVHVTEYTDAPEEPLTPIVYALEQNHPNPFNPTTEISYSLPERCHVRLEVFDVRGRKVTTLFEGDQEPGHKTVYWDGSDAFGDKLPSGVYFYRLSAGRYTESKKMVLLR